MPAPRCPRNRRLTVIQLDSIRTRCSGRRNASHDKEGRCRGAPNRPARGRGQSATWRRPTEVLSTPTAGSWPRGAARRQRRVDARDGTEHRGRPPRRCRSTAARPARPAGSAEVPPALRRNAGAPTRADPARCRRPGSQGGDQNHLPSELSLRLRDPTPVRPLALADGPWPRWGQMQELRARHPFARPKLSVHELASTPSTVGRRTEGRRPHDQKAAM